MFFTPLSQEIVMYWARLWEEFSLPYNDFHNKLCIQLIFTLYSSGQTFGFYMWISSTPNLCLYSSSRLNSV